MVTSSLVGMVLCLATAFLAVATTVHARVQVFVNPLTGNDALMGGAPDSAVRSVHTASDRISTILAQRATNITVLLSPGICL